MKFVMHRNRTISSTLGHSIQFVKGEPTHVPPALYNEVMAAGGIPEEELNLDEADSNAVVEPSDPSARQQSLFEAMESVILSGKRDDFTAAGAPHAKVLSTILGWTVQNKERDAAWAAFKTKDNDA